MPKIPLSDGQRSDRARIAANIRWSKLTTAQRREQTAPGLAAMFARFEAQVDPEGVLSPAERTKLAENARLAQLAQARLKASKTKRKKKTAVMLERRIKEALAADTALTEKQIKTIAKLLDGGGSSVNAGTEGGAA